MAARRRPTWRWAASSTRCGKSSARATLNRCWRRCCSKIPTPAGCCSRPPTPWDRSGRRRRRSASPKRRLSGRIRRARDAARRAARRGGLAADAGQRRGARRRCPAWSSGPDRSGSPKPLPLACDAGRGSCRCSCTRSATGGILHLNWYFALDDLSPGGDPGGVLPRPGAHQRPHPQPQPGGAAAGNPNQAGFAPVWRGGL